MKITFAEEGWSEYLYWQTQDKKPEPLKYGKSGSFSRRIDEANRLVYEISDNQIIVKSCRGHYKD